MNYSTNFTKHITQNMDSLSLFADGESFRRHPTKGIVFYTECRTWAEIWKNGLSLDDMYPTPVPKYQFSFQSKPSNPIHYHCPECEETKNLLNDSESIECNPSSKKCRNCHEDGPLWKLCDNHCCAECEGFGCRDCV